MKQILRLLLALVLTLGCMAGMSLAVFKDVPSNFWGYEAIISASEAGLVKGKSTNADGSMNYAPNDTMTRAEFLTTVLRLFYAEEAARVSQNGAKWWQGYYDLAVSRGVLKAAELDNGALDKAMTREEMALVLHRTAPSLKGFAAVKKASVTAIPDYRTVSNSYKDAVLWVYGAGLIKGMDENGSFNPQNSLTRAQCAAVLEKLVRMQNSGVDIPLPALTAEETTANRQKALVETAMAYYWKGTAVQYDCVALSRGGSYMGARYYANPLRNTPEYASEDMTLYSVCSHFVFTAASQAFGYLFMDSPLYSTTSTLTDTDIETLDDVFVYRYVNTGDVQKDTAAMNKARTLLQPGDVVSYIRSADGGGHVVIYVEDITGDGKPDVLHCSDRNGGGKYKIETGTDKKEANGGIIVNQDHTGRGDAEEFFFSPDGGTSYLLSTTRYSILRPAAADAKKFPISQSTRTRLAFPGLAITYCAEGGFFGSVEQGKTLTYTLTLKNNSAQDHKGLKVQIPTTYNATLTHVDGKEFKENLAVLTVDVPAGSEVTHTFSFKAVGEVGGRIVSTGYVHTIPLPEMHIAITASAPTKEQLHALSTATTLTADNAADAFAEAFCKAAVGKDCDFPTIQQVLEAGFRKKTNGQYTPLEKTIDPIAQMFVTDYFGGRNVSAEILEYDRVVETRAQDAVAGDLLYAVSDINDLSSATVWVYDGENYRGLLGGKAGIVAEEDVAALLSRDFFILLRPSQLA